MFRSALIKMTLVYLIIIMAISVFFSVAVYQASSREIDRGLTRQQKVFQNMNRIPVENFFDRDLIEAHNLQISESNNRLLLELAYINLGVLVVAGVGSYFLARRTLQPIEEAHEAQSRFTADASHELRSPLAAMQSEIEVTLRDKNLTKEDAIQTLKSNLEEVEKLSGLASGLLELTRENGAKLGKKTLPLIDVVQDGVKNVEKKAKAKKISIKVEVAKSIKVTGNKGQLTELFTILLDNAIKYSVAEKSIRVKGIEQTHTVIAEVSDQGYGIEEKDLPHIFDRFYQADTARSKVKVDGYGLGLSIAQKIVTLHKGSIGVESKPGKGSTFTIKFPKS